MDLLQNRRADADNIGEERTSFDDRSSRVAAYANSWIKIRLPKIIKIFTYNMDGTGSTDNTIEERVSPPTNTTPTSTKYIFVLKKMQKGNHHRKPVDLDFLSEHLFLLILLL